MKSERERLIKLLQTVPQEIDGSIGVAKIADHLLSNGVIVPPCKVGDTVYVLDDFIWACDCGECEHFEEGWYGPHECRKTKSFRKAPECTEIKERKVTNKDILQYMSWDDFGKTVFLTKEEAEAELRKRGEASAKNA